MSTLREWFKTIASKLNDAEPGHEFQRYALSDMIAAYNQALCLVAKYRPDLFTELRLVKLVPGRHQDVRGCCTQVLDVIEQTDAKGNIIRLLKGARSHATTAKRLWKKPSCLPTAGTDTFVLANVDIDKNLNGRFSIDPPLPCGVAAYVNVKCVAQPCSVTAANLETAMKSDCLYATAAWHYVLATMLSGDQFASAAGGNKQYHYTLFFNILGVVQKQEDRIESKEEA